MAGYIKVISSLLLVYIISLNTTDWNRRITNENKGHGQICLTWGGINGTSILTSLGNTQPACLLYLFRFSPEYKYFFNRYVGIVPRFGVLDGGHHAGTKEFCYFLSLGVGLEWSYNGTGSNSRIDKTYYGGSIGVLGLWGGMLDVDNGKNQFELDKRDVQVRLTTFKMCKPNGFYMSVDVGCLDIGEVMNNDWVADSIIVPTLVNMAVNIGWNWWV